MSRIEFSDWRGNLLRQVGPNTFEVVQENVLWIRGISGDKAINIPVIDESIRNIRIAKDEIRKKLTETEEPKIFPLDAAE